MMQRLAVQQHSDQQLSTNTSTSTRAGLELVALHCAALPFYHNNIMWSGRELSKGNRNTHHLAASSSSPSFRCAFARLNQTLARDGSISSALLYDSTAEDGSSLNTY